MFEMIKVELMKLRKRRMTWILLGILVGLYIFMFLITYAIANNPPQHMDAETIEGLRDGVILPYSLTIVYSMALGVGSLLLIILVGAAVGNEFGWGTIRQVLTRKGVRYQYVSAKLIAFIICAIIGTIIAFAFGFVMAMITTTAAEGGIDWSFMSASFVGDIFRNYGWTLYSLIPYILLTMTFALLGRSALVGIGATLGYTMIEGIFTGVFGLGNETIAKIGHYLIGPNTEALLPQTQMGGGPMMGGGGTIAPPTTAWAVVTLIIYSVALLGISLWLFKKRDITA